MTNFFKKLACAFGGHGGVRFERISRDGTKGTRFTCKRCDARWVEWDKRRPVRTIPECYRSGPGPQQRAENGCDDCTLQIPCLMPAPRESTERGNQREHGW